ncbi:MAG: ribosomal protein S18 acetylase RimI-like enzyme [Paraglaciecola sp.]|jgi:ribosomal protein S18 acetylase RimI-like enzyme
MELRRAQGNDTHPAGRLILSSATNLFSNIFDLSEKHHALAYLRHAFTRADGQFGHANHWVIIDDGQVVAIATAWHTELPTRFHQATLDSIVSYYGLVGGLDVIQGCQRLQDFIPAPKKDEWCVGHFAVSVSHRRRGLGRKLLAHMQRLAVHNGKHKITLDVELSNQDAINFYLDLGFIFSQNPTPRPTIIGQLAAHGHMFLPI